VDATISRTIASGWPLFTVIVRDVTERRRADEALRRGEAQLRQAQKMEAVGRLAGGIAHDFNNLLTIIRCSAELLLGNLGNRTEERAEAEEIKRTADRASRLTRQLLTFSRKELTRPELLGLDATIASSEELVRRLLLPDVTLVTVPGTGDAQVRTDRGQLEQALMNLAMNAREAMPHGGELVIETATVTLSDPLLHAHGIIRPGQYVTISVSDSGIGMTPEVQAHLFEPFFTTKSGSEASGLGLSTVYGIVQQSGGHIRVRSQAGQGSEFTIYLPLHAQVSGQAQLVAAAPSTPCGSETVLLVEDEPSIRTLVRRILTQRGYRVIEARHGGDALIRLQSTDEVIHLVITDAIMPEMGGRELIERLRVIRPALRTLVISGYTNGEFGDESEDAAFLSKPFTAAGLTNKVRELLDADYAA
jgi:signal transduction histidine kinase